MVKLRHILEYIIFQVFAALVSALPLGAARRIGAFLGSSAYSLWSYRRNVTLDNLRKAFPDKPQDELERVAHGAFRNVGIALSELLWLPRMTHERLRSLVHFDKPEIIKNTYARGKGILLLTAHFGNWELLAQSIITNLGFPVHVIVKTQANPLVDRVINRRRTRLGSKVIPMETSLREVLKGLREGKAIGIVADQAAPRENVPIEFFGRMVPTHQGPAVFSLKVGAPLVAIFSVRQPDGSYNALVHEIPTDDLKEYTQENVVELTRRHTKITEEYIRKYPDHWMWMHKRWKHVTDEKGELP
ncbi:MAG: lysophospholipid acyltransferase family protein [Bacteroidota bacterium]